MKRALTVVIAILAVCAFIMTGCAPKAGPEATQAPEASADAGKSAYNGEIRTCGNIATLVPEGWTLIPGGPGGVENDNSLFLKENEDAYEYIWVTTNTQANIDSSIKYNSSDEIEPVTVNGVTWQGKEAAFYAPIGGRIFFIMTYGYTVRDEVVYQVMASLADAN